MSCHSQLNFAGLDLMTRELDNQFQSFMQEYWWSYHVDMYLASIVCGPTLLREQTLFLPITNFIGFFFSMGNFCHPLYKDYYSNCAQYYTSGPAVNVSLHNDRITQCSPMAIFCSF